MAVAIVLGGLSQAAAETLWTGETGSWFQISNWSDGLPASDIDAVIDNDGTAEVTLPGATADILWLGTTGSGNVEVTDLGTLETGIGMIGSGGDLGSVHLEGSDVSWTSANVSVGNSSSGLLTVSSGASVNNEVTWIGANEGSSGTALVTGPGSHWSTSNSVFIGDSAEGTLTIADGAGVVHEHWSFIGRNPGGNGILTVTDPDSLLTTESEFSIGVESIGMLEIEAGGQVNSLEAILGRDDDGDGTAVITGSGSTWSIGEQLLVGNLGDGALEVLAGGWVESDSATITASSMGTGEALVSGSDSSWVIGDELIVASSGIGSLEIESGGRVESDRASLGVSFLSTGSASVHGDGSSWSVEEDLVLGVSGTGLLEVGGGATVEAQQVQTAEESDGSAEIHVDGTIVTDQFELSEGATLSGSGSIDGPVTVEGTVSPGTAGEPGTLNTEEFTMGSTGVVEIDLETPTVTGDGTNDLVWSDGDLAVDGTLVINPLDGFGPGNYTVFLYFGDFVDNGIEVQGVPDEFNYSLVSDLPSEVRLLVEEKEGELQLDPTTLDFGETPVGATSDPLATTVRNVGEGGLEVDWIGSSGSSFSSVEGADPCPDPPFTLDVEESCQLHYAFQPIEGGLTNHTLAVISDAGSQNLSLVGTGLADELGLAMAGFAGEYVRGDVADGSEQVQFDYDGEVGNIEQIFNVFTVLDEADAELDPATYDALFADFGTDPPDFLRDWTGTVVENVREPKTIDIDVLFEIGPQAPPGDYTLVVSTYDVTGIDPEDVSIGDTGMYELLDQDSEAITILAGEGEIGGMVEVQALGPDEPAAAGAEVAAVENDSEVASDTTDADGLFTLDDLAAGEYEVTADLDGFASGAENVVLEESDSSETVDFLLESNVEAGFAFTVGDEDVDGQVWTGVQEIDELALEAERTDAGAALEFAVELSVRDLDGNALDWSDPAAGIFDPQTVDALEGVTGTGSGDPRYTLGNGMDSAQVLDDFTLVLGDNASQIGEFGLALVDDRFLPESVSHAADSFHVEITTPQSEVFVDAAFAGSDPGETVEFTLPDGSVVEASFGTDAFASLQDALPVAADEGTVYIAPGIYPETGQLHIEQDLSIIGNPDDPPVFVPMESTDAAIGVSIQSRIGGDGPAVSVLQRGLIPGNDDSAAWWLVDSGVEFNLFDVVLDGSDEEIAIGLRHAGTGVVDNVGFRNIQSGTYLGTAMEILGADILVENSHFEDIGRIGMYANGPDAQDVMLLDNVYEGKGDVDGLDYGIQLEAGATVYAQGNVIRNMLAVASSDGSASAGVLLSALDGPGTAVELVSNQIKDAVIGINVGILEDDDSQIDARCNAVAGTEFTVVLRGAEDSVATNNWWGCNDGSGNSACGFESELGDGEVDVGEWVVLALAADPMEILVGETSELTADLLDNVTGQSTLDAAGCMVPDGVGVEFDGGSLGSVDPVDVALEDGIARSTFSGEASGSTSDLTATSGNQSENADILVWPSATLEGEVFSQGYCGADPAPAEGGLIEVTGQEETYSTTVDENGEYSILLPAHESPIDVTASAPDHIPQTETDVSLSGGDTITVDFDLELEAPCATVEPDAFDETIAPDTAETFVLTIGNMDGNTDLGWDLSTDIPEAAAGRFEGPFDPDNWELVNEPSDVGGFVDIEDGPPVELFLTGGDDEVGGHTDFEIGIPSDGVITFDWGYQSDDLGCFDSGGYAIDGDYTVLACNEDEVPFFDESESVAVQAGDTFAFRVETEDGDFGPGQLGVTNFEFEPILCAEPQDVSWLDLDPVSGTTSAGSTDDVDVMVDTDGLDAGSYQAAICVDTDDAEAGQLVVSFDLTVDPTVGPATLEGEVFSQGYCGENPFPAEGALVEVVGQTDTFTATADENGLWQIDLPADESPADVTASAPDHIPQTETDVSFGAGDTVTIDFDLVQETPCATVDPESFIFEVDDDGSDSQTLTVGNIDGAAELDWDVLDPVPTLAFGRDFDPDLDEDLDVPDFSVTGAEDGGNVETFDIEAGLDTSGAVIGFTFEGTVSGISDTGDWASDMNMVVTSPAGESFSVGGFTAPVNDWEFQGGGSSEDGTYVSAHLEADDGSPVFAEDGTADAGDWTFEFTHGWDSDAAGTMDWSDVTVTLHKVDDDATPPVECFDPAEVPWLSVDPTSGSVAAGGEQTADVMVDGSEVSAGTYEADLCVYTSDGNADLFVLPVNLTVAEPPPATLEGEVFSQGYCGENPFPAEGALVEVVGQTDTFTATADENGLWQIDLPADESPADVTASAPDHIAQTETGVSFGAGDTVTIDFDLVVDAPCKTVAPDAFEFTLTAGQSEADELILGNLDGAADLVWSIDLTESGFDGEPAEGDCEAPVEVDWLDVVPDAGTIAAGDSSSVDVQIVTDGLTAGDYQALLCVASNDPENGLVEVPVSLTVEEALASLEGEVFSQGYCGDKPAPAAGASILIQGQDDSYTAVADGDGVYEVELSADESPVTVTALADGHLSESQADVELTAGEATVVDLDLILEAPCASVAPDSLSFALVSGDETGTMTIGNFQGGTTLNWWLDTGDGCYDPAVDTWLTLTGGIALSDGKGSGNPVAAGSSQGVNVTASADNLEPDDYDTVICIATDDSEADAFDVPVSLEVQPDAIFEDRFEVQD